MSLIFDTVLRMSLTGSYCILVVLLVRALLLCAPRKFSYALWLVVFVRLICPVMPESGFSLIPDGGILEEGGIAGMRMPGRQDSPVREERPEKNSPAEVLTEDREFQNGSPAGAGTDGSMTELTGGSDFSGRSGLLRRLGLSGLAGPAQAAGWEAVLEICSLVWLVGAAFFAGFHLWSYFRFKRRVAGAVRAEDGVYEIGEEHLSFVLGIMRPKIYIAAGLTPETRQVVLCHEQVHVKRRDYLLKPAALAVCCLHWFNPLAWLAFYLMNKDCEMSCDECVVRHCGEGSKKVYSFALLREAQAQGGRIRKGGVCALLSFGEDNVKTRISHVLRCKKAPGWALVLIILLMVPVMLGLAFNPAPREMTEEDFLKAVREAGKYSADIPMQCYMADYERDGGQEAYVLVNGIGEEWNGTLWFVSENGETRLLEEQLLFPREASPVYYNAADRDFLLVTYVFGNPWITNVYGVEEGGPVSVIPYGEQKELQGQMIVCQASAYDIQYWAEEDMTLGHSRKPYYFYYDGDGKFQEYTAEELTPEEVAGLAGGQAVLDSLTAKYGVPPEDFQYLLRANGFLHVNIAVQDEGGLTFSYETWKLMGGQYALAEQGDGFYLRGLTVEGGEDYRQRMIGLLAQAESQETSQNAPQGLEGQILDQSFPVTLDGWGDVIFAPFESEYAAKLTDDGGTLYRDVRFVLLQDNRVVSILPDVNPEKGMPGGQFGQVLSVDFRDYNGDGRKDILLVLEYAGVQGLNIISDTVREARVYTQEAGGKDFIIDMPTTDYLNMHGYSDSMELITEGIEAYARHYAAATSRPGWEVESFARDVRQRILEKDWEGLADFVSYPITIGNLTCTDREDFVKGEFADRISEEYLEELAKETCEDMFCNWQGIMLANGKVWIAGVADLNGGQKGLKVIAINLE